MTSGAHSGQRVTPSSSHVTLRILYRSSSQANTVAQRGAARRPAAVLQARRRPRGRLSGWGTRLTDATAVPSYVPAASWPARCHMTRLAPAWPASNA